MNAAWRDAYLKGAAPLPELLSKTFLADAVVADELKRKAAFTISTGAVDRDGDTIHPDGWQLDHYRKNPVVLWAHDTKQPPIATSEKTWVAQGQLKSVARWPEKGVYPFADTVYELVKGGFIRGTSVGFHPIEAAPGEKGIRFQKQELYEYSLLPVPSNREALVEAKAAGIAIAPVVDWAKDFVRSAENGLWLEKETVEKALSALVGRVSVTVPAAPPAGGDSGEGGHAAAGAGSIAKGADVKDMTVEEVLAEVVKGGTPPWLQGKKDDGTPAAPPAAAPPPGVPAKEPEGDEGKQDTDADGDGKPPAQAAIPPAHQAAFSALEQQLPAIIANPDPTAKANALKAALEAFAHALMAQSMPGQAPVPPAAPPATPPPPPPPQKAPGDWTVADVCEQLHMTPDDVRSMLASASKAAFAEARAKASGKLPD